MRSVLHKSTAYDSRKRHAFFARAAVAVMLLGVLSSTLLAAENAPGVEVTSRAAPPAEDPAAAPAPNPLPATAPEVAPAPTTQAATPNSPLKELYAPAAPSRNSSELVEPLSSAGIPSIFYDDNEKDILEQAKQSFIVGRREQVSVVAGASTLLAGDVLPIAQKKQALFYSQVILTNVIYRSATQWVVGTNISKLTSEMPKNEEIGLEVLEVSPGKATLKWTPDKTSLVDWGVEEPGKSVKRDRVAKTLIFTMLTNQTFDGKTLAVYEGRIPRVSKETTRSVAPSSAQKQPEDPKAAQELAAAKTKEKSKPAEKALDASQAAPQPKSSAAPEKLDLTLTAPTPKADPPQANIALEAAPTPASTQNAPAVTEDVAKTSDAVDMNASSKP